MIFPLPSFSPNCPIYIFGGGYCAISYKRQIDKSGFGELILGFIINNSIKKNLLGLKIIDTSTLTTSEISSYQFIIASHKHQNTLKEKLIEIGVPTRNIILPEKMKTQNNKLHNLKNNSIISIYPIIRNQEDYNIIIKRIKSKINTDENNNITHFNIYIDKHITETNEDKRITNHKVQDNEIEIINNLKKSDIIIAWSTHDYDFLDQNKLLSKAILLNPLIIQKNQIRYNYLTAKNAPSKHKKIINKFKNKNKFKILFLVIHKSIWKIDSVFKKMLDSDQFEPLILICPYVLYGENRMWKDMQESYDYFKEKNYPLISAYNNKEKRWITIKELNPDIIFFTNPHNLTRKEYYQDAYLNYLSCYVPYFFLTTTHDGDQSIYNQNFHNAMWLNFMPHSFSLSRATEVAINKGENCYLTGYPFCDYFLSDEIKNNKAWKEQKTIKKKIIFAPHHTIFKDELNISNFLETAEHIKKISLKYSDAIQWSFKPHPILQAKLYTHPDWGKSKTDDYYNFWKTQENTQLDEGEYLSLFSQSDAIIHDCGSFMAEYLFVKKPCAFMNFQQDKQLSSINEFGLSALKSYTILKSLSEINLFVENIISNKQDLKINHLEFINKYIIEFYKNSTPTDKILEIITNKLKQEIPYV